MIAGVLLGFFAGVGVTTIVGVVVMVWIARRAWRAASQAETMRRAASAAAHRGATP